MADLADIEAALVAAVAGALYPAGPAAPSASGGVFRIYRGYPGNAALEADLAAGICHVGVQAIAGATSALPAVPAVWEYPHPAAPSLAIGTDGASATVTGNAAPGQLAGLLVDDAAFVYRTAAGDTPALVAAALAARVASVRAATVAGAVVAVPGAQRLVGRVVADQAALMQTRRQRAALRVTCWCPAPATRDAAAGAIDAALAQVNFLPLADGSAGRLQYLRTDSMDDLATLPLYRRDLDYTMDYATTLAQVQSSMLFGLFTANTHLQIS